MYKAVLATEYSASSSHVFDFFYENIVKRSEIYSQLQSRIKWMILFLFVPCIISKFNIETFIPIK